jgi:biotin transport system substrate-specific component
MHANSLKNKNIYNVGASFSEYIEKYSGDYAIPSNTERMLVQFSFSLVFVILMWISANSFVYLPFTPVPVTMQVFTVLFCGIALGKTWALVSQLEYLVLGLAGFPLFAGFKNGLAVLLGPTGGYVIGFAAAAFLTGFVYKKLSLKFAGTGIDVFLACICGMAVIYLSGLFHLAGFLYQVSGQTGGAELLLTAFKAGVLPFVVFDLLKIMAIVTIQKAAERKRQSV